MVDADDDAEDDDSVQERLPTGCCCRFNRPVGDTNVTHWLENKLAPVNSAGYEVHQDVSTSRDTGFRRPGSRVILNRVFSLDPSISCPFSQSGPVKVDQTLNTSFLEPGGTYGQL
jgi:hypothetical protein